MKRKSQREIINELSDRELILNLYASQLMFLFIALILAWFLFDSMDTFLSLFQWNFQEIFIYGIIPGLVVVTIDILLIKFLPETSYDDGGVNKRIFKTLTIPQIFIVTLLIAVSEELLFRGIIHTFLGYFIASVIFALVHFRYLKKPVLFISVIVVSFFIGYVYEETGNLFAPMATHFVVDFILGLIIRYQK